MGGEGRNPDRELLRNLLAELERAAEREERLTARLDDLIGLAREVERNRTDLKGIHKDLYGPGGIVSRVDEFGARFERHEAIPTFVNGDDEAVGGIFLPTPVVVSIALFVLGATITGVWHIVDWIVELAKAAGR